MQQHWYYAELKCGLLIESDAFSDTDGSILIDHYFNSEAEAEQFIVDQDLRITIIPSGSREGWIADNVTH